MNISAKTLYKSGSISMMILGTGHLATHFAMKGRNPALAGLIQQMGEAKIVLMGTSRSLLEMKEGFSITMGVLLFLMGLQNLLLAGNLKNAFENNKAILLSPILFAATVFGLSVKYFFLAPQTFSLFAFCAYSLSFWKLSNEYN